MQDEIWKDTEYAGYMVSNKGRVKNKRTNHILSLYNGRRYLQVNLSGYGTKKVHRLVAQAFIKNQNNLPCVNHKDGDKSNNNVDNLEWCSYLFNNKHSIIKLKNQGYKGKGNILCIETGDVFESSQDIKRKTGIFPQSISSVLNGKTKTAFGYHWERTNLQTTNVDCSKYRKKYGWKARLAKELGISRSCLHQRLKAGWNMSKIKKTTVVLIFFLALAGCAKTTPTENIIGQHVQLVDEALSNPTLSNEAKGALKTCRAGLLSAQETHQAEISKCDAEKSKLKTERNGLFLAVLLLVGFMLYRPVRKLFGL